MVVDPNFSDDPTCDYKKIQELCKTFKVEFKNQTFNATTLAQINLSDITKNLGFIE